MTAAQLTEPRNKNHVDVNHPGEVIWWCAHLSVTPVELRKAVETVGPSAEEIRTHLKEAARRSFRNLGED